MEVGAGPTWNQKHSSDCKSLVEGTRGGELILGLFVAGELRLRLGSLHL